jgi:hypothetical protein
MLNAPSHSAGQFSQLHFVFKAQQAQELLYEVQ